MKYPEKITSLLAKLIADGRGILRSAVKSYQYGPANVIHDRERIRRWSNELILFNSLAGGMLRPWARRLRHDGFRNSVEHIEEPLHALETIQYAIENDLLTSYRDLIYAEAYGDLFEQGQALFDQGYFLAAGVIFRAVLEERLRKLCEQHDCVPEKERPTLNEHNQALYKHEPPVYGKSMMLNVTSLAAVGNDAAHNKPNLKKEDVERLMTGVLDFLGRFSPE